MRGVALALAIPVVFVLGVRLVMTTILQSQNHNADSLLKGLIQGVLMYHAMLSTYQAISIALFLGMGGRLVGDFVVRCDGWKVASTLLGTAFGVVMADIISCLYEDTEWTTIDIFDDIWETCAVDERLRRRPPRLGRRVSEPRRIEEFPTVYEELSSIDSRSRIEDVEPQSDVEREVTRLRAKALSAAGQQRRFREERKWAWSQGNFARAFQLRWQVKKYQALADSFTREADQKLIEADRAKRRPPSPPQEKCYYRPEREPAPFVQVVVERGIQERDFVDDERTEESISSPEQTHKAITKTTSRTARDVTKYVSGVNIDSRGYLTRSGHTRDPVLSGSSDQSPATSDTWSRQLD